MDRVDRVRSGDLVGRQLSAVVDLLTVMLVFLIDSRLYNRRIGVLAAAFSAFAVLQIQLSHYFTVDTFSNFFTFLAFYFAVRVMDHIGPVRQEEADLDPDEEEDAERVGIQVYPRTGCLCFLELHSAWR